MHDLIIVGAGPAGLALAYYLRDLDLDIRILEATDDIGGRARSVDLAGAPVNTGAMFVYRGTRAEELALELGQAMKPFHPSTYGVHYAGKTSVATTNDEVVAALPISPGSKAALLRFMDQILAEYQANVVDGSISAQADSLASETVADRLFGLPEDVARIIETAVRGGSVGDSSQLSAKYALRYLGSYIAREKNNRLYPVNGMQGLPRALAGRAGNNTKILTQTQVTRIEPKEDCLEIHTVDSEDRREAFRARQVAVTVPGPLVEGICSGLPQWKTSALRSAYTPSGSTLTVAADVDGLPEYAEWAFVSTVGKAFDAIINPTPGTTDDGIVRFTCYGNSAGFIPGFGEDPRLIQSWIDDFIDVAPGLRDRILGFQAQTWRYCFAALSPQRAENVPALRRSVGNIHFAGDYTSITAGTHGAYDEGFRVALEIREDLAGDRRSRPSTTSANQMHLS